MARRRRREGAIAVPAGQPPLFCDDDHRHRDAVSAKTVTGDIPIGEPETRRCDDGDDGDGIIRHADGVRELALAYFSTPRRSEKNTVTTVTSSRPDKSPCKTRVSSCDDAANKIVTTRRNIVTDDEELPGKLPEFVAAARKRASERGLVAKWSRVFGFVAVHDPLSGEWHDVPAKFAPAWAKWEAGKRKALHKSGNRRAYDLSADELREIWEVEHPPARGEGIIEDFPIEDEEG